MYIDGFDKNKATSSHTHPAVTSIRIELDTPPFHRSLHLTIETSKINRYLTVLINNLCFGSGQ